MKEPRIYAQHEIAGWDGEQALWILWCTFNNDMAFLGGVDNEIDAVTLAANHIEQFHHEHVLYMHMQALTPKLHEAFLEYHKVPYGFDFDQEVLHMEKAKEKILNCGHNLYRPPPEYAEELMKLEELA